MKKQTLLLLAGDAFVLLIVTLIGLSSHDRLNSGALRMIANFVPLLVGWLLIGTHVGVFDPEKITNPRHLWRPFWTMVLAGPFAGWLRAVILGAPAIVPIFVVILGGLSALAMLGWRGLYLVLVKRFSHG